jgi:hypothetical protein
MLGSWQMLKAFEVKKDAEEFAEARREELPLDEQPIFDGHGLVQGRVYEVIELKLAMEDHLEYVEGFMDGVDWQHELGEAPGGIKVYMDEEDLLEHRDCVKQCGIVKVRVNKMYWTKPQNFSWEKKDDGES